MNIAQQFADYKAAKQKERLAKGQWLRDALLLTFPETTFVFNSPIRDTESDELLPTGTAQFEVEGVRFAFVESSDTRNDIHFYGQISDDIASFTYLDTLMIDEDIITNCFLDDEFVEDMNRLILEHLEEVGEAVPC